MKILILFFLPIYSFPLESKSIDVVKKQIETIQSCEYENSDTANPIFGLLVRRVLFSYAKRITKRTIKNRFVRYGTNQAIKYGIDYVADNLSYSEQNHIKSEWAYKESDTYHAHNCSVCSSIAERVINKTVDYSSGKSYYSSSSSNENEHNGTKMNIGLTFTTPLNGTFKDFRESSDAFSGYNFSLEHNLGFVQFEGGYRHYQTTNDQYTLDKYVERNAFLNVAATYPYISFISPHIGIGYMYNKTTIEEPNQNVNFNNSAPFYFGGLDIKVSEQFYFYGKYLKSFKADEFDFYTIEGGIKYRWVN